MSYPEFYDLDAVEQIAVNLFYGWGYNFYRAENQVRADDLLVRQKVSSILGQCRDIFAQELAQYRRTFLPLPTREKPMPDEASIIDARLIEDLAARIGQIEGTIRSLPVPENDRITQRFRQELETLVKLREHDARLVGRAQVLLNTLNGKDHDWILQNADRLRAALNVMLAAIQARQDLLQL